MCTSFRLRAADGSVVAGRSMEFAIDLASELIAVPAGTAFDATAPEGHDGLSWEATYGYVGMNSLAAPLVCDGANEAGLYVGSLYFPGFVGYQEPGAGPHLAPEDVNGWLLGTCATVTEAASALGEVRVWPHVAPPLGAPLPLHWTLHDRSGASLVIEHVAGEMHVYENPLGVMTNSPPFDWHLVNLRNFVNLSVTNVGPAVLDGDTVAPLGQGSGLLGLPGDWTPPSRFVRMVALSQGVARTADSTEAVVAALHLLNVVDIPRGLVREGDGSDAVEELTQWATVADLAAGRYYARFYDDPRVREVDIAEAVARVDGPMAIGAAVAPSPWTLPVAFDAGRRVDPAQRPF